jgi:hypothetical protein
MTSTSLAQTLFGQLPVRTAIEELDGDRHVSAMKLLGGESIPAAPSGFARTPPG